MIRFFITTTLCCLLTYSKSTAQVKVKESIKEFRATFKSINSNEELELAKVKLNEVLQECKNEENAAFGNKQNAVRYYQFALYNHLGEVIKHDNMVAIDYIFTGLKILEDINFSNSKYSENGNNYTNPNLSNKDNLYVVAYFNIGNLYDNQGKYALAKEYLIKSINCNPDDKNRDVSLLAYHEYAKILEKEDNFALAGTTIINTINYYNNSSTDTKAKVDSFTFNALLQNNINYWDHMVGYIVTKGVQDALSAKQLLDVANFYYNKNKSKLGFKNTFSFDREPDLHELATDYYLQPRVIQSGKNNVDYIFQLNDFRDNFAQTMVREQTDSNDLLDKGFLIFDTKKTLDSTIQYLITTITTTDAMSCTKLEELSQLAEKNKMPTKEKEWNTAVEKCIAKEKKAETKRVSDQKKSDRKYARRNKGFTLYVGWYPQNYYYKADTSHPNSEWGGHVILNAKKVQHEFSYIQINNRRGYFNQIENTFKEGAAGYARVNGYRAHYMLRVKKDGRKGSYTNACIGLGYTNRVLDAQSVVSTYMPTNVATAYLPKSSEQQVELLFGYSACFIRKLGIDFALYMGPTYNMFVTDMPTFGKADYSYSNNLYSTIKPDGYFSFTGKIKMSIGLAL